jgi:hypothetical protein
LWQVYFLYSVETKLANQIPAQSQQTTSNPDLLEQNPTAQKGYLSSVYRLESCRATKKHYGTFVEPGKSPVAPERFHGYHTGTDFEILTGEENTDVPVMAVCSGKVLRKEQARGYGGMVVESCLYNGSPIVVTYGHVRIASMKEQIGDTLTQSKKFIVLGTGYSKETDGERKHLHLSIHKGPSIVTSGYVSNKSELTAWYDPESLF